MLAGTLVLERLDGRGRAVERRKQPMSSFTKGFIELLYVAHANLPSASPYSLPNINEYESVDIDSAADSDLRPKATLLVAAPSGKGSVYPVVGYTSVDYAYRRLPAELVGVQVGAGTAAVTPTDRSLASRIMHGKSQGEASPVAFEVCNTGDDADYPVYGARWSCQSLEHLTPQRIVGVRLLLGRVGLPGTVTVGLRDSLTGADILSGTTDGDTLPTAAPWEWRQIALAPVRVEYVFEEPPEYSPRYLVVRATGGDIDNRVLWRYNSANPYPYGRRYYSLDSGASWSSDTYHDFMFELLRQFPNNQLEYGGCEVDNLVAANPNASFEIRRQFYNRCGATTTVNEVGIYAAGAGYGDRRAWPFCIARDLVSPGIDVLDGEVLRVTYTVQITV